MFITLEGIEGCGKTTQAGLLNRFLVKSGYKTLLTREPGGPAISEKIRAVLLDPEHDKMVVETELLLYLASRAQHTAQWILPALKEDIIVICDRYTDSTLAYQGGGRKIPMKTLLELTRYASYELKPDIVLLIDIPAELAMQRIADKKLDRLEKEDLSFYKRVRQIFLDVANRDKNRYIIINGDDKIETINERISKIVMQKIKDGLK